MFDVTADIDRSMSRDTSADAALSINPRLAQMRIKALNNRLTGYRRQVRPDEVRSRQVFPCLGDAVTTRLLSVE